ncbi:AraC family transcriptional regulator [Leptospira meyeri]|uniref:AraC family transcriptional regulator n=1 Tax=Leptospira meyeri TaxID=29508 RepID=UPI000C2A795D|nr:helix-turn-helix domain-containing protein [Leptospira meyeri]MCW7487715.1 helix-turn-helix domain-containing protein [Leptospira meyeri]PJZ79931.1 AraC family transcriptional regulator [Leptospira meyeri]PJZ96111.1 AraC family transcriptional regulator [Leptospira meyeri]
MNLIPFAGAVVSSLLAIAHWIKINENRFLEDHQIITSIPTENRFLYRYAPSFLFLSLTILQFHIYVELTNQIHVLPFFYGIHIPCLLLIGPLSYIFFEDMSGGGFKKIRWYHFLPSLFGFIYLFVVWSKISSLPLLDSKDHHSISFDHFSIGILLCLGVLSIFGYTVAILIRIFRWKSDFNKTIGSSFLPFLCFLGYSLLVVTLFVIAQLFFMQIFLVACAGLTFLLAYILLLKINHKELIPNFKKETRLARYQESRIKGVDITLVLQQLEELMSSEKLFLNEDLSLAVLSKRLGISSHQLSEILNSKLNSTFRNYVNGFRLQESARLLLEQPQMTILSVIYASGFNSKSSFHKLFQNRFGLSPQKYRSQSD